MGWNWRRQTNTAKTRKTERTDWSFNMEVAEENTETEEHGVDTVQTDRGAAPPPNPLVRHRRDDVKLAKVIQLLLRSCSLGDGLSHRCLPEDLMRLAVKGRWPQSSKTRGPVQRRSCFTNLGVWRCTAVAKVTNRELPVELCSSLSQGFFYAHRAMNWCNKLQRHMHFSVASLSDVLHCRKSICIALSCRPASSLL